MDSQEEPLPLLTLTVPNNGELRTGQNNSDSESQDSIRNNDPNRFNAYLNRGSELWTHWTWLGGQGKMSLMRCNYCLVNKQLKNAPKCRRHLIKCQKTPELIRRYFERKEIEASRVSAFMREIRSKEIKFPRSESTKHLEEPKLPKPTANDLKHLHQKQQASINSASMTIANGLNTTTTTITSTTTTTTSSTSSTATSLSTSSSSSPNGGISNGTSLLNGVSKSSTSTKYSPSDLINKTSILMNYSPMINRSSKNNDHSSSKNNSNNNNSNNNNSNNNKDNQQHSPNGDSMMNDVNYNLLYQLMSMNPMPSDSAIDSSPTCYPILSNKLKRKHEIILPNNNTGNNSGVPENIATSNNTVVINLDDISIDDGIYFNNPMENGHSERDSLLLNGSRKKKRHSCNSNGYSSKSVYRNGNDLRNGYTNNNNTNNNNNNNSNNNHHHHQNEFPHIDSQDIDIVHDDLNDLLMSSLISHGIDIDFVRNSYFQKFITQLVKFSTSNKNYRLPSVDKLITDNISNLMRKFDYETTKIFSECDSIIVSFENNHNNETLMAQSLISKRLNHNGVGNNKKNERRLNVNLLISTSNTCFNLFFKTIFCSSKSSLSSSSYSNDEIDIKLLNNQIDSLFNKLGPDQINAVILPYKDKNCSELIYSYLSACHNHIVPLTNSYRLFHHLLCDICRIPSIYKLIIQCVTLFQELETNLFDFHEENENLWKQVFESDNLKIFKYFLNTNDTTVVPKNTYWISLNLMLCWFLVARSSILKLLEKERHKNNDNNNLIGIVEKSQLEVSQLEPFFDQISILFNFLTPFINAMHLIENESTVISDIIKIYYDVKLAINNNNFFNGINKVCDKTERQKIDCILNEYLQEQNFSRYFFLAYYLDPRFRDDRRIEENEELTAQVYDALFNYANALGCVNNEEEDREKLADSLEEFRNGDKLYGMQLLKCPKSPSKFWKHLLRFPGSSKLAYCASRLLSISTRSMLITTPIEDYCTRSLYEKILQYQQSDDSNGIEIDYNAADKVLPIKSYLLSSCQKIPIVEEEENNMKHPDCVKNGDNNYQQYNGGSSGGSWNGSNISNIISNVITSLDQYKLFIAQPFSTSDLSTFIQPPSN